MVRQYPNKLLVAYCCYFVRHANYLNNFELHDKLYKELNVESAGMLLRENDYAEVAVGISETPYRG